MSESQFPVLEAMRRDAAHPVDPWGGALLRLLEAIDAPATERKRFTNTLLGRDLMYRATWRDAYSPWLWLESRTLVARGKDGREHDWPVGALLASVKSGPALGLSTVELVLMAPNGQITPIPGRPVVDWRPFSHNAQDDISFPDQLRAKNGLLTARLASREQLLQMASKVALIDGFYVNVIEEGLGSWVKNAAEHAALLNAAHEGEDLRAFLAGVCVERAGPGLSYDVRQDTSAAALLERLADHFVVSNQLAQIAVGALQCERYAS